MNSGAEIYMEMQYGSMSMGAPFMRFEPPNNDTTFGVLTFVNDVAAIAKAIERIVEQRAIEQAQVFMPPPLPEPTLWQRVWAVLNMNVRDVWTLLRGKVKSWR